MKVKCVREVGNPDIRVGNLYDAQRNAFGWNVKYSHGTHVMPDDVFRQCFNEV